MEGICVYTGHVAVKNCYKMKLAFGVAKDLLELVIEAEKPVQKLLSRECGKKSRSRTVEKSGSALRVCKTLLRVIHIRVGKNV